MAPKFKDNKVTVGLDIGTTKICAVVGETKGGELSIIGIGSSPSHGLKKGVVVNIEATVHSINLAIADAELMCGRSIRSVFAGIAGSHIKGFNHQGSTKIKNHIVSEADVERAIAAAKAVEIPSDREIIHIFPQEFIIDGQDGIRKPIGMAGTRLETKIHIVTGAISSAQNIVTCVQRCSLKVNDIVLEPIASAFSVLSDDERELGVALVDIGGGTTDIALFHGGAIQYTSVIPIGGHHLTNDIAVGLRTPQENAETAKIESGCASSKMIGKDEVIEVPSIGNRPERILRRQILGDILEPRVKEIFELVAQEIDKSHMKGSLASGVVLTGGSSLLPGMVEVAENITGLPTRHGFPQGIKGMSDRVNSPIYATGVGLALYGAQNYAQSHFRTDEDNIYSKVRKRMGAWLSDML